MQMITRATLRDRRVLLVDDESMVLLLVEDMLRELGAASVETAMGLEEATQVAETAAFDVAVLDVNLSGRVSYPVAERLRARRIPFLFATAYGSGAHGRAWSGSVTVAKPFTTQDLAKALETVLAASGRTG